MSHKRSYQSTGSYIRDFSFRNTSRRFGMFLNHNSQSLFGEYRSMPGVLIQTHLLVWSTNPEDARMLQDITFSINRVIIDQLVFNLVDICFDNTL